MRYIRTSEHTTFILYIDLPYLAHIEQAYMKSKRVTVISEATDSEFNVGLSDESLHRGPWAVNVIISYMLLQAYPRAVSDNGTCTSVNALAVLVCRSRLSLLGEQTGPYVATL